MLDWNDLRYFLAVARDGSTLAAGKALRVSQTTVARRVTALEGALGLKLFERRQAGYALTPAGEELIAQAEEVEAAALKFGNAADSCTRDLRGTVRLTAEEIFSVTLFGPLLRELHDLHPEILIDLDSGQALRDLGAGEADVALRSTVGDQPAGVVGRAICIDDWTLYCSREYAARHGVPRNLKELHNHALIGGGGGNLWRHYEAWLRQLGLEDQVAMHHATSTGLLSGVRSGFGIAVLPCIIADSDPDLVQCLPPREGHGRTLWLLTHERVRHSPRVRTVIDFLYKGLIRHVRGVESAPANSEDRPASQA